MGGFNFIFCVAENFIKTVGFDFIVSNANDFIKNSESSTLSTKNIKTSFLYPTGKNRIEHFVQSCFLVLPTHFPRDLNPLVIHKFNLTAYGGGILNLIYGQPQAEKINPLPLRGSC